MGKILIVDDDPWVRQMVGTMLMRGGHEVETAGDGAIGLEKVASFTPDLIMTDVLMEHVDGWTLVRKLRSNAATSMIPVIFLSALTSDEDRIRGLRLGADDYMPKPFRFEELNLRIERTLRAIARIKETADGLRKQQADNPSLKGDLSQLGVASILTILEMERKSGVLALSGVQNAHLFISKGNIVAATIEESPEIKHTDAVCHVLTWDTGTFQFCALDVDMPDEVKSSVQHLLMEAARRVDEESANGQ